jgi:hypothetical protein
VDTERGGGGRSAGQHQGQASEVEKFSRSRHLAPGEEVARALALSGLIPYVSFQLVQQMLTTYNGDTTDPLEKVGGPARAHESLSLNRLVRKGYGKLVNLQRNRISYPLTPEGIAENSGSPMSICNTPSGFTRRPGWSCGLYSAPPRGRA